MKNIIHTFDLYGKHISLYTKSSSKATTFIGFVFTIISFLLLGFILYIECYEVIKRESPNVVSYKHARNSINSTLPLSNETFNFFINIVSNYEKKNFMDYLVIHSYAQFNNNDFLSGIDIPFEYCNTGDKANFQNHIENFEFPTSGFNLCPRIDYNYLQNFKNFQRFDFSFIINECSKKDSSCTINNDFYKRMRKGSANILAKLCFVNNEIDLTNYEYPYWLNVKDFYTWNGLINGVVIELEGSEIHSKSIFSFNTPAVNSRLSYSRSYRTPHIGSEILSFNFRFYSNDSYIYIRTYKTFNVALATSFALFKLINQIISIILSPLYNYYMNTIIINKNFSYGLSTQVNGIVNNFEPSAERRVSAELINVRPKKLTTISALKNVSLFRYALCRRRNKTKTFYDQAKFVIYKTLSVENLLQFLIEYYRLKKFLYNNVDDSGNPFSPGKCKLILNGKVKDRKRELHIEELLENNNFIENDIK
jgi:hypothetical protein